MNNARAIAELSTLIQPGDRLTLFTGETFVSGGSPQNNSDWLTSWLVGVWIEGCRIPINLYAVTRVCRGDVEIWNNEDEREPVQDRMLI